MVKLGYILPMLLHLLLTRRMDNSRGECLPQTAVAKTSAHAAGTSYPRLALARSVADSGLWEGAGLAEGKSGSKWLRSSTRRGAAGAAQAAKAPVGLLNVRVYVGNFLRSRSHIFLCHIFLSYCETHLI